MKGDSISHDVYDDPEFYDLLFSGERSLAAQRFYCQEAAHVAGPILELACGSGQLTIPLALAGLQVTGLDLSDSMMAAAARKAEVAGLDVRFVRGDMRDFNLAGPFAAVMIGGNSLLHLLTNEDLRRCFAAVQRHLAPGGRLMFDLSKWPLGRFDSCGERRLLGDMNGYRVEELSAYDAAAQVRHITWYIGDRVIEYSLRVIFPQELPLLLELTGFRLVTRYGEFTREPFGSDSPRQVCICEAI